MSLDQLASALDGALVLPDSADFDTARLYHGRRGTPAAVVTVAGVGDVVLAIAAARAVGLPVAVRGGEHSNWESLPGALVVDLRALDEVEVDETAARAADGARLVHVGGGATWADVADALSRHGLAVSSGDTRLVGVGGPPSAQGSAGSCCCGLALDQLAGVQLVTADNEVLELSAPAHPELFWGVRGGGGNPGVGHPVRLPRPPAARRRARAHHPRRRRPASAGPGGSGT